MIVKYSSFLNKYLTSNATSPFIPIRAVFQIEKAQQKSYHQIQVIGTLEVNVNCEFGQKYQVNNQTSRPTNMMESLKEEEEEDYLKSEDN